MAKSGEDSNLDRVLTGMVDAGFADIAVNHALDPRNQGNMDGADGYACYTGPCGDTMEIWIKADEERVVRVSFFTDGCGSAIACGSIVTEMAAGLDLRQAADIEQDDILKRLGGLPEESRHCALLAATTLKMAIEDCGG